MAVSVYSWSARNGKPSVCICTVMIDQIIHTANPQNRAGIESQRLRLATRLPVASQKVASSGAHAARLPVVP